MSDKQFNSHRQEYLYQLLDRLRTDCEYYLGNGNHYPNVLWAGNEQGQIAKMKEIWNELEEKPEWLTWEDIIEYAKKMGVEELPSTQDNTAKKEIQDMLDRNYEKEKKVGLGEGYNVSTKEYNKFCKDYDIDPNDYDDVLFTLDELEGQFGDKNGKLQRIREYVINKVNDGLEVLDQTEKEQTLEKPFNDFVLVYQLQESKGYRFMSYEYAKDKINLDDYELVAKVPLYKEYNDVNEALEYVFSYSNSNADFYRNNSKARSISVSDILQYKENNYYVDSFGFVLIGKGDKLIEANIHSGSENSNIDLEKEKEDIQKQLNDVEEIETMKKELDDKMDDLFEENKKIKTEEDEEFNKFKSALGESKPVELGDKEHNWNSLIIRENEIAKPDDVLAVLDRRKLYELNYTNGKKDLVRIYSVEFGHRIVCKSYISGLEFKLDILDMLKDGRLVETDYLLENKEIEDIDSKDLTVLDLYNSLLQGSSEYDTDMFQINNVPDTIVVGYEITEEGIKKFKSVLEQPIKDMKIDDYDNVLYITINGNSKDINEFVQAVIGNISDKEFDKYFIWPTDNELKESKESKTDSIYYTYSIYTKKDKNDTWTWKDSFENKGINDKKEAEEKAKARVKELKDSGEFFDVMYKEWENDREEEKKYDIDISEYDTVDKIKARIKEINAELAYCRRRDKVCATFGGDQQVYDLNVERDKLKTKLNQVNRTKKESRDWSENELEIVSKVMKRNGNLDYKEFLKELELAKEGKSDKIKIYSNNKEIKNESEKIDLNKKLTPEEIRNVKLQDLDKDVQDYIKEIDTLENIQKHLNKLGNYYSKFKDSKDDEDFQKEPIISLNDYLKTYKKEFKKGSK